MFAWEISGDQRTDSMLYRVSDYVTMCHAEEIEMYNHSFCKSVVLDNELLSVVCSLLLVRKILMFAGRCPGIAAMILLGCVAFGEWFVS